MSDAMRQVDILRAACCVAGVDGHASDAEQRILKRLADEAGVGTASLSAMIERAETDKRFYAEQFRVLQFDPKETMQLLFRVALADGDLAKEEAVVLKRLSQRLELPPSQFDAWLKQAVSFLKKKKPQRDT
jgi:uncharacterized tellurite resistance protein B-like protein